MGELFIWLSTHPDVKVRFNYDPIFHAFRIRVIKGRYISEHMLTEDEYEIFLKNDKDETRLYYNCNFVKLIISIISRLYDEIEKEINNERV